MLCQTSLQTNNTKRWCIWLQLMPSSDQKNYMHGQKTKNFLTDQLTKQDFRDSGGDNSPPLGSPHRPQDNNRNVEKICDMSQLWGAQTKAQFPLKCQVKLVNNHGSVFLKHNIPQSYSWLSWWAIMMMGYRRQKWPRAQTFPRNQEFINSFQVFISSLPLHHTEINYTLIRIWEYFCCHSNTVYFCCHLNTVFESGD